MTGAKLRPEVTYQATPRVRVVESNPEEGEEEAESNTSAGQ